MNSAEKYIWVFHGAGASFASGVFDDLNLAKSWITDNKLEGVLTAYPLNQGVYHWALDNNLFTPTLPSHFRNTFIQKFTAASQEHYHFDGENNPLKDY